MMEALHVWIRYLHVVLGFLGLTAFWFPVFAKKGGPLHVAAGRVFVWCGYAVTVSAVYSCVYYLASYTARGITPADDPNYGYLVFLAYLAVVAFAGIRHGVVVARTKTDRSAADTASHRLLAWATIVGTVLVGSFALTFWTPVSPVLLALSPVGIMQGWPMLRYVSSRPRIARAWFYEHMVSMLGAGVAFHTAFAVLGSQRLFDLHLVGFWATLPWILPVAIGIPGSILWDRYYRRKFGDRRNSFLSQVASL